MALSYSEIMWLLTAHFIADYVMQDTYTGMNKSKQFGVLLHHIAVYAYTMTALCFPIFLFNPSKNYLLFIFTNAIAHMGTDLITSKLSTKYYEQGRIYAFWKVIGIDQLAHYAFLFYSYVYYFKYV